MQLHDLNPHVINSLLCLGGIVLCLVLIGWGMISDRQQHAAADEPAADQAPAPARPSHPAARRAHGPAPRLTYRQVA
jgi:hypothetical protein